MKYVLTRLKRYSRDLKRTLNEGKEMDYTAFQFVLPIPEKESPFEDKQEVMIISIKHKNKVLNCDNDKVQLENNSKELKESNNELLGTVNIQKSTINDLSTEINRLRNQQDHLQERLRISLKEINQHRKIINDLSSRGFVDYILGRQPESLKMLEGGKNEHKKLKIPDIKREW